LVLVERVMRALAGALAAATPYLAHLRRQAAVAVAAFRLAQPTPGHQAALVEALRLAQHLIQQRAHQERRVKDLKAGIAPMATLEPGMAAVVAVQVVLAEMPRFRLAAMLEQA
jgi:hypothetical protein